MSSQLLTNLTKIQREISFDSEWVEAIMNHQEYEKPKYIPIEFIQGTGAQMLITGVSPNSNTTLDTNLTSIKYKLKEIVDYSNLIINRTKLEYTKLEYIESTGTQYIDTGITMNKTDSVTIEQECAISNNNYSGANAYTQWTGNITNNSKCIVKVVYTSSNTTETIYVNDILKSSDSWSSYNGSNNKIGIFKLGDSNNSWHSEAAQSGKLYYCKIIKNNVLVRDFISVKDTNGIPCLYDKVTQEFFYNVGTGNFIAGPEIS